VRKIQQLPPPDSKREEADAYTRAMQETLFALEHNRDLSEDIIKHARAVGFKVCGTEFSS
jgi:hypothetical protein